MKVSLFVTCLGDLFFVNASKATVELLEHLGCEVEFPKAQTCCGQPTFNSGYHEQTREVAKHMIETFDHAEYVVSPSGSCAYMFHAYEDLFAEDDVWREKARKLKEKTYELTQFIVEVLQLTDVGATFEGTATYHSSCHMTRLLGVKEAPFTLLNNVQGLNMIDLPNRSDCCGFGGTFAVKMSSISGEMVEEKAEHIESTEAQYLIGADGGCLLNIGGRLHHNGSEVKVLHIAEVLNNREVNK
ncbi:MAG TPA: (Fe-S)-binding protein [Candidatus Pseudogracilibacillus intestinigallinarum]|uniref:Lactate utilization protein A n=1 Tax=Candidatus Pseudogracilibacillus intestinigallinarum TaxID=2838742 RepID=A0A9D1TKY6_9BACI|nr:(Fe-S)-binding protein [Candidatus Pseudogracilibacillus intestinigallinarum]